MIVNVSRGDECRIAVLSDGKLEELFYERQSVESHVYNIYKGVVTNVEPSIQAAFIDFGIGRNGFLHISDLQPQYFPGDHHEREGVGQKISRRDRPPIQKCLKRGDIVIVQVTKEGIGTKGPTLTTYLSLPGRYLVMMPGMSRLGVSRKIEDDEGRQDARDALKSLQLPPDMGFILRTAGRGQTKRELQRDLNYMERLWKIIVDGIKHTDPPVLLYQETNLLMRTMRDVLTPDVARIVIDDAETVRQAREFLHLVMPRNVDIVEHYTDKEPIFHRFRIEEEIERLNSKKVPLRSGGSLVIESTEALVAIDVNSGRYRTPDSAEETAFKINMEAAEEIARQLRLRDLGGLIICDFIDMQRDAHKRKVEKQIRDALKKHKERAEILRMSLFGIIEMTRQRQRASMQRSLYSDCPACKGTGLIKTPETMMLDVMRLIQLAIHHNTVHRLKVTVSPDVGLHLLNRKRRALAQLEEELGKIVVIQVDQSLAVEAHRFEAEDVRGRHVVLPEFARQPEPPVQERT